MAGIEVLRGTRVDKGERLESSEGSESRMEWTDIELSELTGKEMGRELYD